MYYRISILFSVLLFAVGLYAQDKVQQISISGKVISSNTQRPLSGVRISIEGTKLGTVSAADGKFQIKGVPNGEYSIKFSYVGYAPYIEPNVIVNSVKPAILNIELSEKMKETEEVEVRAAYFNRNPDAISSARSLSAEEVRRTPGAQEDVVRTVALMPGVAVTSAGRNDLIVRGGAPFENLFIVDNIEAPNINHFGTQGSSGGPLSIINIDYVKSADFSSGAFGAKYGDKTSSITNIQLRNGNEEKFGGKANLSATGFGLNLEGPISNSGSFLFSARRSYLDLIFKAAGFAFIPEYWDFQAKANYRIDDRNSLSFLVIGALGSVKLNNDDADKIYDNSRVTIPNQDQYFSGLTWKNVFNSGYFIATLGETFTKYKVYQNDNSPNPTKIFYNNSTEAETSLRTDLELSLDKGWDLSIGNQFKYASKLEYDLSIPAFLRTDQNGIGKALTVDTNFKSYKNSTYFSLNSSMFQSLKLTLGARADYYSLLDTKWYFSPRGAALYQMNEISAFTLSAGRYYQSPSYIWMIGAPQNRELKAIQADQIVLGYEHTPMQDLKVQFEVFYKKYDNYPARVYRPQAVLAPSGFDDINNDIPYGLEPLISSGSGFSRGVELFIQKKLSEIPLYGLLSLSISESKFKSLDGVERPGAYDTRFIGNLSAGYKINSLWELSGKFRIASGQPTTPYLPSGMKNFGKYNEGDRLPIFHALDLRVDKKWNFDSFYLVTYIDIQNIYGRKNVSSIKWNSKENKVEENSGIGILPSIGVSLEF
jgi:hypothetical protein